MHECLRSALELILDHFYLCATLWNFYNLIQCLTDSYACFRFMLKVDYFVLFAIKRDFWKSERVETFITDL
ncbi:hypothetical protein HanRHA438_Chr02g0047391 [Helianthus annuus]|nr:hypothetical protein HanRHA438_Chr02g0047391 [Helianthus annuus]